MIIKVNDNGTIKSCNVPDVSDIPTKVSDLTDDSGHYTKPSGGIPASDLADGVIPDLPVSRGTGTQSLIIGDTTNNIASQTFSYAEGNRTTASGSNAHSEGYSTQASGDQSHAEGGTTTASGTNSHAEGGGTTSSGSQSHAEGAGTIAYGSNAHAEGAGTTASKENAHSEGAQTTASGSNSHAEGASTTASGGQSHSEGLQTTAQGFQSHAEGWGTIAGSANQHVQGKFNVADYNDVYAHIVGGGSSTSSRNNIQTLDWNGNEAITGNLTISKGTINEVEITPNIIKPLIIAALPASADLNSYTTPGNYTADSTVIASITHAPTTTVEYKLTVEQISDEVIKQTVTTTETPANVYQRTGDSSSTNWVFGDWVKQIKSTDYATSSASGVVKINSDYGIYMRSDNTLGINAASDSQIKAGTNGSRPIVSVNEHSATFYGLAKAAGDTTQTVSSNAVGTYTDNAKTAIRTMLGVVGPEDYATATTGGVVKITAGAGGGINLNASNQLITLKATSAQAKAGTDSYHPIVPYNEHEAAFYGLAKAAGDATQVASSNAVGTYTQEAKTAIQAMLGVTVPEAVGSCVEYISDSSVTIVGEPNTRYVCGEVTSISITPPAVGTIDVTFTSGSTIAILTLPSTVKMPEWWGGVETGYTYELVITDGTYAGVMAWPQ